MKFKTGWKTMTEFQKKLFDLRDVEYAAFQAKLTPTVPAELFIGVRVPQVRTLAKELVKSSQYKPTKSAQTAVSKFLSQLPHKYYDENMLHGLLISEMEDFDTCVAAVDDFLPFVDNWAVCDIMSPKVFKKHKPELLKKIREWAGSTDVYTCRFGLEMLMKYFLDADFKPEYLKLPAAARGEDYYVKMMVAWFFATALAKQWTATIPYIEKQKLALWTHNKAIQKAIESYRITDSQKDYLRRLKK